MKKNENNVISESFAWHWPEKDIDAILLNNIRVLSKMDYGKGLPVTAGIREGFRPGLLPDARPQEKCGIFAVYNYRGPANAAIITYLGLLALQHRGQESAGIAYKTANGFEFIKGMGHVDNVFSRKVLEQVTAGTILGHVRYSTTGSSSITNAQPLVARFFDRSGIALAHNGNLTNTRRLRRKLLEEGQIFHTTSDTEILLSYLSRFRGGGLNYAVKKTMRIIEGAYAAVVLEGDQLAAFRDPCGFRPLVIGRLGEAYIFASETAALDTVGADFIREVLTPADEQYHINKHLFKVPFVCGARDLGEALRRISEGAAMIRTKGEPGTGNVVEAVRHMRKVMDQIRMVVGKAEDELVVLAKEMGVSLELLKEVKAEERLPVVNFAAGGIASPADAALMMQLGSDGIFVGSGIFKSENPERVAEAIVKATLHYDDPKALLEVSKGLGQAMPGLEMATLTEADRMQERGI